MQAKKYSHNYGKHALSTTLLDELLAIIEDITFEPSRQSSSFLRELINESLIHRGWALNAQLDQRSKICITAQKSKVGLCVQTGNISRYYADLLKLETLFKKDIINSSILIVPTKDLAKKLGNNIANSERINNELQIFRHTITVPIITIAVY